MSQYADAIIALISSLLGATVGFAASIITAKVTQKAERQKLTYESRRTAYMRLISAISEYEVVAASVRSAFDMKSTLPNDAALSAMQGHLSAFHAVLSAILEVKLVASSTVTESVCTFERTFLVRESLRELTPECMVARDRMCQAMNVDIGDIL